MSPTVVASDHPINRRFKISAALNGEFLLKMSRSVRKAIEHAKQKKEHELRFSDEGITELSTTYPELCKCH